MDENSIKTLDIFLKKRCDYYEICPNHLSRTNAIIIRDFIERQDTAISHLIIDGYNIIGTSHRDLAAERERLVCLLVQYKKLKGHDITLVFDGWNSSRHKEEWIVTGGITVIYTRTGDKADEVIKKIVDENCREWIVISSDREIAAHAWGRGSVAVPSEAFLPLLSKGMEGASSGECEPINDDDFAKSKKGSSRQPSKREKALQRAMKKL